MEKRKTAILALLSVAVLWGAAGPVIKATLGYLPPFTFLFCRFLLASVACLPLFFYQWRQKDYGLADLGRLFVLGLLSTTVNLGLIFSGFAKTTALDGSLISAVSPIFIVIGGVIFFKDKVSRLEKFGLGLVVLGTLITVVQPLLEKKALALENLSGNLLILLAGLEWTAYVLLAKKWFKKYSPGILTTSGSLVAVLTFWPLSLLEKQAPLNFHPLAFFGVFYMAIFSYVIAYFFYNYGVSKIEVSEAAVFAYLQPVFAAPLAVLWLKETITLPFILGAGVIALGVFLSEVRSSRF